MRDAQDWCTRRHLEAAPAIDPMLATGSVPEGVMSRELTLSTVVLQNTFRCTMRTARFTNELRKGAQR
jgi:hypothetical protein